MAGHAHNPWLDQFEHVARRWGHFGPVLLSATIGAVIVMGFYPPGGQFAVTAPLLLFSFVIASWLLMRQHDRRLCEHCAAALPLNPAEQAARYRRRFSVAHMASQPRYVLPYLAVLIGSNFATAPATRIGWALIQASMIYLLLSYSSHRKLQPWCPWCRGDGGRGDDEDIAPPPPHDHHQLTR